MDYMGDKLNSFAGEAMTGINELKRKRQRQSQQQLQRVDKQELDDETAIPLESRPVVTSRQQPVFGDSNQPATTGIYGFDLGRIKQGPLSAGVPFGGDAPTYPKLTSPPPPVGFKPIQVDPTAPEHGDEAKRKQATHDDEGSSLSLYEGDTWSRLWFQRVLILTLLRLLLFIRKVYEDYSAFRVYSSIGLIGRCLISAATLFLPTIVFTIYRIARYLQIALPSVRDTTPMPLAAIQDSSQEQVHKSSKDLEDAHSRRALMSSPSESMSPQQPLQQQSEVSSQQEEDGLATARQTPTNEEFHDTQSDQRVHMDSTHVTTASPSGDGPLKASQDDSGRKSQEPRLESVDINKLGNLPDKHTTRIFLGASEQLLHGLLFIFWQLKRQVDLVGYLVERACLWRRPKEKEKEQLIHLRFGGDGLEWFQDFYAAFLAILVQVHSLGSFWSGETRNLAGATTGTGQSGSEIEKTISKSASLFGTYILTNNSGDLLIVSEIIISCLVVSSLLVAVRRHDDGPLTLGLSMLGWGSIFAARIIIIALAFVHIGWHIMIPLILIHIVAITSWIYKIAIDSHNGKADETEEHRWAPVSIEDAAAELGGDSKQGADGTSTQPATTSLWSTMEHHTLICQIVTLFAIPSLFYWPIMFNLKLHARPFKYLALIMSENFLLIAAMWLHITSSASSSAEWYLLGTVGACSIIGFIFVSLYVACKPSLTEYFARADEIINQAERSGIYYEFCSRVFRMPDLTKHAFTRLMNQQEQTVVEVIEGREQMSEVDLD